VLCKNFANFRLGHHFAIISRDSSLSTF
jgi:hypothetical protein